VRKIRIVIADDEPLARGYLRSLLADESDCEIVADCGDAEATVAAIAAHDPDLVFLDVQMPGRDGFSVIERVGSDAMPHTVFVTAHDRYAIPAFERHALDYLLKPFSEERFREALARVRQQLTLQHDAAWSRKLRGVLGSVLDDSALAMPESSPAEAPASGRHVEHLERLPVKAGGRVVLVSAGDIDWIEAADYYVNLHCGREVHLLRETMNALEAQLDPQTFIRIHRGSIVNINRVKEIINERSGGHRVILKDGTSLTLSRRRKKDVERLLGRGF
jgi:two-component system LytT family response regulator